MFPATHANGFATRTRPYSCPSIESSVKTVEAPQGLSHSEHRRAPAGRRESLGRLYSDAHQLVVDRLARKGRPLRDPLQSFLSRLRTRGFSGHRHKEPRQDLCRTPKSSDSNSASARLLFGASLPAPIAAQTRNARRAAPAIAGSIAAVGLGHGLRGPSIYLQK